MLFYISIAEGQSPKNPTHGQWLGAMLLEAPHKQAAETLAVTILAAETGSDQPVQLSTQPILGGFRVPPGVVGKLYRSIETFQKESGLRPQRKEVRR